MGADKLADLRQKVEERTKQIQEIQREIDAYKKEIDKSLKESQSLKSEIFRLELIAKKLAKDISLTERQIESSELSIERLSIEIDEKAESIYKNHEALGEILRRTYEEEATSLVELTLASNNFSDFFNEVQRSEDFEKAIQSKLSELKTIKIEFEEEKSDKEKEKKNLEGYKARLNDEKKLTNINKTAKNSVLKETKNKEENFKKLLADRLAKELALEAEVREFESQIRVEIDPKSLPAAGRGVLNWPVDNVLITQYFGNTDFATKNPQVYSGKGHNGIDLRASEGTAVKSAESGKIIDAGDTDMTCPGASYGKWILLEHTNGLSTLYAHLSIIKTTPGQKVASGQLIGYSGNTGYSTGPHVHFAVFAARGVKVDQLKSKVPGCGTYTIPVASQSSYLNPLSYL